MLKKRIKTLRCISGIRLLRELFDNSLVIVKQQMEEFVELENIQASKLGGSADFGLSFFNYWRCNCHRNSKTVTFYIYLSLGVYLHVVVEHLLLTDTISPIRDKRRFATEVSRRFAIVSFGSTLELL